MSLGLVSYGESDDSDEEPSATRASRSRPSGFHSGSSNKLPPPYPPPSFGGGIPYNGPPDLSRPPPPIPRFPMAAPPSQGFPNEKFKRPPQPTFPSAMPQEGMLHQRSPAAQQQQFPPPQAPAQRQANQSTYASSLGGNRDEKGKVRITAPRLEHADSDEEAEEASRVKRARTAASAAGSNQGGAGLFAVLPDPKGSGKRNESKSNEIEKMFAKKRIESSNQSQTIKVPSASTVRYEAELKKAQLIQKFLKKEKAPVEESRHGTGQNRSRGIPATEEGVMEENDYLGLTIRSVDEYPVRQEDLQWEVDESAYEEDDFDQQDAYSAPPSEPSQPGIMWTANYKYEDVRYMVDQPLPPPPVPAGYRSDAQVEKLIARFEGPEFIEMLSRGHTLDIVDFRADDHLGNARANVMKALTDQEANPPPKPVPVKGKTNRLAKQKGQITYLAAQAQAREGELQNQWAKNKQTRNQAASKYGF